MTLSDAQRVSLARFTRNSRGNWVTAYEGGLDKSMAATLTKRGALQSRLRYKPTRHGETITEYRLL